MLNFKLNSDDKYEGRCAEIYITEKSILVYHCSVCEEIYATFNELLSHITKDHYKYAKEYRENESASNDLQNSNKEEDTLEEDYFIACKEEVVLDYNYETTNKSEDSNDVEDEEQSNHIEFCKEKQDSYKTMLTTITILDDTQEIEDLQCSFDTLKSSPHRKKPRVVTGMLKSNVINRTKLNPLTRYPPASNNLERKYICGICGFAFKEKFNLRGHLLRHSNQKNFSCTLCTKKFFTKMELRLHEHRHKGERPYLCYHCGMGFVSNGSLTQHIKKQHSLHRPFKCDNCDKSFPNFYQLKNHQHVHSDERLFQCFECSAAFKMQTTLNSHLKMHENKRKLRCEYCDLGFGTESALKTHRRKKHDHDDDEYEEDELLVELNTNDDDDKAVDEEDVVDIVANCKDSEIFETSLEPDNNI